MDKHIIKICSGLIVILLFIFLWGYFCDRLLTETSSSIDSTASTVENLIKEKKWEEVDKTLSEMNKEWDKTEPKWAILIDHFEIDNIDNSFTRMSKFVEVRASDEALAEVGALRKYIQHIPQKNALTLKNVL